MDKAIIDNLDNESLVDLLESLKQLDDECKEKIRNMGENGNE